MLSHAGPATAGKHRRIALLTAAWIVGVLCGLLASTLLPAASSAPHTPRGSGAGLFADALPGRGGSGLRTSLITAIGAGATSGHSDKLALRDGVTAAAAPPPPPAAGVLVLYSFFAGDEESWGNLRFFVRHGVSAGDGARYIVILNGMHDLADARLPWLPANAHYVLHSNECYDWGTYAWALAEQARPTDYKYFIFINSSVRGPLLPWYALPGGHWTQLFTRKLTDSVKLVGPAISCEHFCLRRPKAGGGTELQCRRNAHVQSVAVATDSAQVGLAVLERAGYVLQCHGSRDHAVYYGEIGASLALLQAGYTIDSFLARYQGVDWRNESNWGCNGAVSPLGKRTFDGATVGPYEAVFPKLKGSLLASGLPQHFAVQRAAAWQDTPAEQRNITGNWYLGPEGLTIRAEDVIISQRRGIDCFDWDYYATKNRDVAHLPRAAQWRHFLARGALEFREHRWKCGLDGQAVFDALAQRG